jgi:hypothetical protein
MPARAYPHAFDGDLNALRAARYARGLAAVA